MRIYKGCIIHKADRNASGIRYECFTDIGRLRAQTLTGIKALISEIKG